MSSIVLTFQGSLSEFQQALAMLTPLGESSAIINLIKTNQEANMAVFDELKAGIADLKATVADELTQVEKKIQDLIDAAANGSISTDQLIELKGDIGTVKANVQAMVKDEPVIT